MLFLILHKAVTSLITNGYGRSIYHISQLCMIVCYMRIGRDARAIGGQQFG